MPSNIHGIRGPLRPNQANNHNIEKENRPLIGLATSTGFHFLRNLLDCDEYTTRIRNRIAANSINGAMNELRKVLSPEDIGFIKLYLKKPFEFLKDGESVSKILQTFKNALKNPFKNACDLTDFDQNFLYLKQSPILPVLAGSIFDVVIDREMPTTSLQGKALKMVGGAIVTGATALALGTSAPEAVVGYGLYKLVSGITTVVGNCLKPTGHRLGGR